MGVVYEARNTHLLIGEIRGNIWMAEAVSARAVFGIRASITNASSPLVTIMAATTAPNETAPWEYMATTVKAPRQPGVAPSRDANRYWLMRPRARQRAHLARLKTFRYSISIIIAATKPVIMRLSSRMWVMQDSQVGGVLARRCPLEAIVCHAAIRI